MKLGWFEKYYPLAGAMIAYASLHKNGVPIPEVYATPISGAFFSIFSVLFGFVAASLSIFYTIQERKSIKTLKTSGAFRKIISYHFFAAMWCIAALAMAFIVTLSVGQDAIFSCKISTWAMLSIGVGALLASFRVIHMLYLTLSLDSTQT